MPVQGVAFSPDGQVLASCGDSPDGGIETIVWFAQARAAPIRPAETSVARAAPYPSPQLFNHGPP